MCSRCGDSLILGRALTPADAGLCRACSLVPPPFVRAVTYGTYDGRLRDLVHALKYGRLSPAAEELGCRLASAMGKLAGDAPEEMLVVPVPLHRAKHASRGFNQAQLLAAEAVRALHVTHPEWRLTLAPHVLVRGRATDSQAGLTPRQRRLNLRRVFAVTDARLVIGKDILLVDDILTTGATARAAASALLDAGAASVWVATLSRARRHFAEAVAFFSAQQNVPDIAPGLNPQLARQHQPSF